MSGDHVGQRHAAGGDRAGLVEHDGVDPARRLEDLRTLDEDAELGAAPRADEQRRRGGESERARAGDDECRDGRGERRFGTAADEQPDGERREREPDDHRHEHRRHPVGEPLHLGLAGLRLLDEPGHDRELGLGADPGRLHDETPARVDGRPDDAIAGTDLDRNRFAGEHARVDGGAAFDDEAVGGDLLARPHDEAVADDEVARRDAHLDAVAQHRSHTSRPARAAP